MTARRSKTTLHEKQSLDCPTAKRRSGKQPIKHSVYIGRQRLGRYQEIVCKRYQAFDADERPLGGFRTRRKALAAIRKTQEIRS